MEARTIYQACLGTGAVSESSSGSGVLQGISNTTGGRSSREMREVEAASGGSSPNSIATSGKAAHAEGSIQGPSPGNSRFARVR